MAFIGKIAVAAFVCASSFPQASANQFLHMKDREEREQVMREIMERTLLAELAMDASHLAKYEDALRPMYAALPKNEHGLLEPTAVRYALHRYFVQHHGRFVKGLEPQGQAWNTSSATTVMKSRVPSYIESLFAQRLHGQGMGLHDVAIFAATLSDFVHNEALADVMDLYKAFDLSSTSVLKKEEADKVIRAYVLQLLNENVTINSLADLEQEEVWMIEDYPAWDEFKEWVEDVRATVAYRRSRRSLQPQGYSLDSMYEEVQELSDSLGAYQDISCRHLKAGLGEIEYKNTGRVLMSDFYRVGMEGKHLFIEHTDFLRRLGALDETDPQYPKLIIVNYMLSQANCLASTGFHTVCCYDECQGLQGHLEREIAAPTAPPSRISDLVSKLRSDTLDAPRTLSAPLLNRLQEIADHHDGQVPLHGRLFAQWMHHAYPLECSFPHTSGTTSPLSPDEWMEASGADEVMAEENFRKAFIKESQPSIDAEALPWLAVEEMVVAHKRAHRKGTGLARKLAAFVAVLALAVPLARLAMSAVMPKQAAVEKFCV